MADLLEFRLSKLARMSVIFDNWLMVIWPLRSASKSQKSPTNTRAKWCVSNENAGGKELCPCEFSVGCISCNLPSFH